MSPLKRPQVTQNRLHLFSIIGGLLLSAHFQADAREALRTAATEPATQSAVAEPEREAPCHAEQSETTRDLVGEAKARALLNLARCRLVTQCAPAMTQELHDIVEARDTLRQVLSDAMREIDEAEKLLNLLGESDAEADHEDLRDRIELLRTFANIFQALATFKDTPDDRERLIDACGDLSLFVDDSRKAVAESARVWQGLGYLRAGKADRALQVLRPTLTTPRTGRLGFYARILRCRALAAQGHHVVAIALAQRLTSRVEAWFADDDSPSRTAAADAIRFLRAELLEGLEVAHRKAGLDELAEQCAAESRKLLRGQSLPLPSDRLLLLTETIVGVIPFEVASDPDEP